MEFSLDAEGNLCTSIARTSGEEKEGEEEKKKKKKESSSMQMKIVAHFLHLEASSHSLLLPCKLLTPLKQR